MSRTQLGTLDDTMETYDKLNAYIKTLTTPAAPAPASPTTHAPAPAPSKTDLLPSSRLHPAKDQIVSRQPEYAMNEKNEQVLRRVTTTYTDGTVVAETPGVKAIKRPNGAQEIHKTSGEYRIQSPDGTIETGKGDGTVILTYPDGTRDITLPLPDGRLQRQYRDGRVINEYPHGMNVKQEEDGRTIITMLARTRRTAHPDDRKGAQETEPAVGYSRTVYPDGNTVTVWSDGRVDKQNGSDRTHVTLPDGRTFTY